MVCIVCPLSCDMEVTEQDDKLIVTGNTCKRGEVYAKNEYTNPVRMLTTTIKLHDSIHPLLPVISSSMIPKDKIKQCLEVLYNFEITSPVKEGDIIINNILGTGIDIISAKTVATIRGK